MQRGRKGCVAGRWEKRLAPVPSHGTQLESQTQAAVELSTRGMQHAQHDVARQQGQHTLSTFPVRTQY